ncbi:MAG: flavodoxin family protein [Eubacteriales bacterium]
MKVGIIIHSRTGNTLSVAQKIKEKLTEAGHSVSLEQIKAANDEPSAAGPLQLLNEPDIKDYELLIFGAAVHGFQLSAAMKTYLSRLQTLKGKKIVCFVTHHFPYQWMGGNGAVKKMKSLCYDKGEKILLTDIINWSNKNREAEIIKLLEKVSVLC